MKPKQLLVLSGLSLLLVCALRLSARREATAETQAKHGGATNAQNVVPAMTGTTTVTAPTLNAAHKIVTTAVNVISTEPSPAPEAVREPQFAAFAQWMSRYEQADDATKTTLEAEGEILAQQRLTALADLVQSNPERALQLALAPEQQENLPVAIRAFLETPVNAKGDLAVIASIPMPGQASGVPSVFRTATVNGETYHAFTFGLGQQFVTKQNIPLNGYAVPTSAATQPPVNPLVRASHLLALNPNPVRVIHQPKRDPRVAAIIKAAQGADPLCAVSGQSWQDKGEESAAEIGGQIFTFCGAAHLRQLTDQVVATAGLTTAGGGASLATAESSYTEGRKRMLLMRPYWSDQAVAMTTNSALSHFSNFSNYMWQMSYGRLRFAPLGQGSDISTELLIPGSVNSYISGLGNATNDAWKAVKDVATTNYGYDLSKYDFYYYVTAGQPSASYAGLGFVGGVGFHLANGYFDAATAGHEFGHNLGLNHANFWNTDGRSIAGFGQSIEYGDGNDPMGGGGSPNHYNSRYKNSLGFIRDTDITNLTSSGTYRLYAHDGIDVPGSLRGLKYVRTASQNYWVQFRQNFGSKALADGVQLLWTGNGNEHSQLLDSRLKSSSSDNALVAGRTFSDTNLGLHITPIGKAHTYPEAMDVTINVGSFPANVPPTASVSASTTNASTGQTISFSTSASDANGDTLAYYWDFDDTDYSVDNSATTTHSFSSVGEYVVQCFVSDMKGGVAIDSVIVRVGSPATFRISGHVLDANNRPVAGARVFVNSTANAITDSDGKYTLARLSAGSYTVDVNDRMIDSGYGLHPFFNNPVTVGPNFTTADFSSAPLNGFYSALVAKKSGGWKYLDAGADQGTAWTANGFGDGAWNTGTGILGYGSSVNTDVTTGLTANRTNTYYFRKSFTVADPTVFSSLLLEVLRESGVIVYVNGTEVYRDNMPAGAVSYLTAAANNVTAHTYRRAVVPASLLVAGANVVTAELHLFGPGDGQTRFDLGLNALPLSVSTNQHFVYISNPDERQNFSTAASVSIDAGASSSRGTVSLVEFYADGAKLGESAVAPYNFLWSGAAAGAHALRAVATIAGGGPVTSAPVNITVSVPAAPQVALGFIQSNAVWRYFGTTVAAASGWTNLGFNDSAWASGISRFGSNSGPNTNINTVIDIGPPGARYPAAYFRKAFVVNDPASITSLIVTLSRDDGAVVYLNGMELFRDGIAAGAVTYATLATSAADNGQGYYPVTVSPAGLVPGTNVVAVEVHQTSAGSSDTAFDLWLNGLASTNRARGCWLAGPTNGASVALPSGVTLNAEVVAGGNLGVSNVEFYADGALVGSDVASPFSFVWNNPPGGAHALVAVAYDSTGATITSAPVNITVSSAPSGDALISFGDVWKYLDDGSDQGTAWKTNTFNDSTWMAGPGRLGYGGDGELTTVSYGTNANSKYITTYFRKKFIVSNPAAFSGLLLRLIRDDGAVVYLNGVEIYRTNLLAGPVSYNSLALAAIGSADETNILDLLLTTTGLIAGTNTLAVEMHQESITSSDLGFDLALIGLHNTNTTQGLYLTSPAHGAHYNLPATVALSASAASTGGAITLVEYFDGGALVGQGVAAPYPVSWAGAPPGLHTLTAVATYGAGLRMTSPAIAIVVGPAPPAITPVFTPLIGYGSAWKYWDSVGTVSNGWTGWSFDDAAWPVGNGRFGWGLDGEATLLTSGRITHYFRRTFVSTNGGALASLTFNVLRDDGVIVYLNGAEVFRTNMPAGPVDGTTLASATINTPEETIPVQYTISTALSGLLHGTNVVAVELHQASAASSDAGFDLSLYGEGTTEARVYLTAPANGSAQVTGQPISVEAQAQAQAGRTLTTVEFFSDGTNFGQVTALPYRVNWSGATSGSHLITARTIDNFGFSITSAPVQINVGYQTVSLVLVPSNSVWKYLDNGSNQGTNWAQTNYNDGAWTSGPAQLGYGGNGENTTVGFGPVANNKFITTYFRRGFVLPTETVITNLTFRIVRDDGAVVWLNGREIYRINMPAGTIVNTTLASASIGNGPDEQTYYANVFVSTNVVPGTNIVAVEMHQAATNSSDLSFNLQLEGGGYVVSTTAPRLVASNVGGQFRIAWPASATGYQLYVCPQLGAGNWQLVAYVPTQNNGFNVLTIPVTNAAAFYRLQKP